jgi:hypothetical protein
MTFPDHYLLSFGGALGSAGKEHWSCGIRLVADAVGEGGWDEEDYLENIAEPRLTEWMTRANSHIGFMAFLDFAKFNRIDSQGNYANPGTPHTRFFHVAGNGGSSTLPYQACIVVTTRSHEVSAGPASRGRFYQPLPAVTVGTDGLFAAAVAADIADSARILMDNLEDSAGLGLATIRPHIVSGAYNTSHQIDYVTVDNRVDTQRRRANQLRGAVSVSSDIDY